MYEFTRPGSGSEKLTVGFALLATRLRVAPSGEYKIDWAITAMPPGMRNKIPAFACPWLPSKPTTCNEGGGVGVGTGTSAAASSAAHDRAIARRPAANVDIATSRAIEHPQLTRHPWILRNCTWPANVISFVVLACFPLGH